MRIMNDEERKLVNDNLGLVDYVIQRRITIPVSAAFEYEDLRQIGSLALCRAAQKYDGRCKFATFATVVIRNALLDYLDRAGHDSRLLHIEDDLYAENGNLNRALSTCPDLDSSLRAGELAGILEKARQRYTGIALKGVEAMVMKVNGYSNEEIAHYYGSTADNVRAWMSRARKKLMVEQKI